MTRRRQLWRLCALVVLVLCAATPAAAGGFATSGRPVYSAFGNDNVGDCPMAAVAGLTKHEFPSARVTTSEVLAGWRWAMANGDDEIQFMQSQGFDGYRIASAFPVATHAQFIHAANHGGVEAVIFGGTHAVAVIAANAHGLWWIDYGYLSHVSWAMWANIYHAQWPALGVNWAPRDTRDVVVQFAGAYETDAMTPQVEPIGASAPLEPLGMVNLGYQFLGWSTNANGTGTLYPDGATFHFVRGTVLWADWTYTG